MINQDSRIMWKISSILVAGQQIMQDIHKN
jgi:hypothetical protein